ncbi:uncharacterized protein [Penaeus vannamei]|uniref:uncharacterized protein n=1 Tax=Penaeus vannamei TaxID=6689 RepID=UPI00387FA22A
MGSSGEVGPASPPLRQNQSAVFDINENARERGTVLIHHHPNVRLVGRSPWELHRQTMGPTACRPLLYGAMLVGVAEFGAWNIQSLWQDERLPLLSREMKQLGVEVGTLSEVRRPGRSKISMVVEVSLVDECITALRLKHAFGFVSLIAVYAHTDVCKHSVKEAFYAKLTSVVDKCLWRDICIVLSDFNAYQGSNLHCWTWYSDMGIVAEEIDHILVSTRWRILLNCRVYRIAELESIGECLRTRQNFISLETLEATDACCVARLNNNRDLRCSLVCRVRLLLRRDKEQFIRNLAEEIKSNFLVNDVRPAYKDLRKLNSNPSPQSLQSAQFSRLSQIMLGSLNVGQLYQVGPPVDSLDVRDVAILVFDPSISEGPPTLNEVREVISKLKGGKTAGICDIPAELLKVEGEPMARGLHAVLAAIWFHSP